MSELRQSLPDDRKEALKNLVQVGSHDLEIWYAKEKSGALSREAAQIGARDKLSQLRHADNNYFGGRDDRRDGLIGSALQLTTTARRQISIFFVISLTLRRMASAYCPRNEQEGWT